MLALAKHLLRLVSYKFINTSHRRGFSVLEDVGGLLGNTAPLLFDIGANQGQTLASFRTFFPQATIHSFEPVRATFEKLRRHAGDAGKTHCHQIAFGAVAGEATLFRQPESQWNSLSPTINVHTGEAAELVQVHTVDAFCLAAGIEQIDLLKTDTEGFDLEVLKGASRMLKGQHINFIYSEVGIRVGDPRHTSLSQLLTFLESQGYYLFALYDLPHKICPFESEYCNALFRADRRL